MTLQQYIDNIKLELTGGVLELELPDSTLGQVVNRALQEVQRFIDSTEILTVPFARCIDLSNSNVSSVSRVYRTSGFMGDTESPTGGVMDPMYVQQWMAFTNGGTMYNLQNYVSNYIAYNTLMQMRNTTSTDLDFKEDRQANKLYISCQTNVPEMITIEYVPKFQTVEQVKSDYWIDILQRLSIAQTKVILGRIRSRYTQSGALWTQDGEIMLSEGTEELKELREQLNVNSQLIYPRD